MLSVLKNQWECLVFLFYKEISAIIVNLLDYGWSPSTRRDDHLFPDGYKPQLQNKTTYKKGKGYLLQPSSISHSCCIFLSVCFPKQMALFYRTSLFKRQLPMELRYPFVFQLRQTQLSLNLSHLLKKWISHTHLSYPKLIMMFSRMVMSLRNLQNLLDDYIRCVSLEDEQVRCFKTPNKNP